MDSNSKLGDKMDIKIRHWFNHKIIYRCKANSMKEAVKNAIDDNICLDSADFSGVDFSGIDLRGVRLVDVNFKNAILKHVNFERTNLFGVNFMNADLEGALFGNAHFNGTCFHDAKNYHDNLDVFLYIIQIIDSKEGLKQSEWELIGKMTVRRTVWRSQKKIPKKPAYRLLKLLDKHGHKAYLNSFREEGFFFGRIR